MQRATVSVTEAGASVVPDQAQTKTDRSYRLPCPRAEPFHCPRVQRPLLPGRSTQDGRTTVDWDNRFYPLDAIRDWNRIYGSKGFAQFQCALPLDRSENGLTALLAAIAKTGSGSFLAILKRFGRQDSAFSFPMEGYTLALNFPINCQDPCVAQSSGSDYNQSRWALLSREGQPDERSNVARFGFARG